MEKVVNAFDWRNFECPVSGKIDMSQQNRDKIASIKVAKFVDKRRETHPKHGTMFGISNKDITIKPAQRMKR